MNETKDKKQVLRRLFFSTLYLSAFTFGGGYVIVTLLKKNSWMNATGSRRTKCWTSSPSPNPRRGPSR